jgi:hypothetical protein
MQNEEEIPCTKCAAWNRKDYNFDCNPNGCEELTSWLLKRNSPKVCDKFSTYIV